LWFVVDRVQRTQTSRGSELVASRQRHGLSHGGAVRFGSVKRRWITKVDIRAFTEDGGIIRNTMKEMNRWLDEVDVLTDVLRN